MESGSTDVHNRIIARLGWVGYIQRMGDNQLNNNEKSDRGRRIGKLKRGWIDEVVQNVRLSDFCKSAIGT